MPDLFHQSQESIRGQVSSQDVLYSSSHGHTAAPEIRPNVQYAPQERTTEPQQHTCMWCTRDNCKVSEHSHRQTATFGINYPHFQHIELTCLESRRDQLSRPFFQQICQPYSCLYHLLPPQRDTSVLSRLRTATRTISRTEKYCSFINFTLNYYHTTALTYTSSRHLFSRLSFVLYIDLLCALFAASLVLLNYSALRCKNVNNYLYITSQR